MKTKCVFHLAIGLVTSIASVYAAPVQFIQLKDLGPGRLVAKSQGTTRLAHERLSLGGASKLSRSNKSERIQRYFDHLFDGQVLDGKEFSMIEELVADFSKRGESAADIRHIQTKLLRLKVDVLRNERERVQFGEKDVYPYVKKNIGLQLEKLFRIDFKDLYLNEERTIFTQNELERWIDHFLNTDESTFPVQSFLEVMGILTGRYDVLSPKTHDARLLNENDIETAAEPILDVDPFMIRPLVIAYQTSKERLTLPEQVFLKLPAVQRDGKRLDLDSDNIIPVYSDENGSFTYIAESATKNGYVKYRLQISK